MHRVSHCCVDVTAYDGLAVKFWRRFSREVDATNTWEQSLAYFQHFDAVQATEVLADQNVDGLTAEHFERADAVRGYHGTDLALGQELAQRIT